MSFKTKAVHVEKDESVSAEAWKCPPSRVPADRHVEPFHQQRRQSQEKPSTSVVITSARVGQWRPAHPSPCRRRRSHRLNGVCRSHYDATMKKSPLLNPRFETKSIARYAKELILYESTIIKVFRNHARTNGINNGRQRPRKMVAAAARRRCARAH